VSRIAGLLRVGGLLVVILLFVGIAIANRGPVLINLDPFGSDIAGPGLMSLGVQMPLFMALFVAFTCGFAAGGVALWLGTRSQRKEARAHRRTERVAEKKNSTVVKDAAKLTPQLKAETEADAVSRLPLTG